MKRFMQICFIILVLFILAFGLFQLATAASTMTVAPGAVPNVSWNAHATGFPLGGDEPNVGWNSKPTAFIWPGIQPCVGWNT